MSTFRDNYWLRGRISRRAALRGAALGLAGLAGAALVGCGSDDEAAPSGGSGTATAGATRSATQSAVATPASTVKYGGDARVVWETEPIGVMDPHRVASGFVTPIRYLMYNGFYRRDWDDITVWAPEIVESREDVEPGIFVFKIRPGIPLHDLSETVSSELVKWNVDRQTAPGFLYDGGFSGATEGLVVETIDDLTIKFSFSPAKVQNVDNFLALGSGLTNIISRAQSEKLGEDFSRDPVGTGPFKFDSWDVGTSMTLKKWDQYFLKDRAGNDFPYLNSIKLINLPEAAVRVLSIQSGEIDQTKIEPRDVPTLKDDPNVNVSLGGGEILCFWLNHTAPPFNNIHYRQAIAHAVDRQALADALWFGTAVPASGYASTSPWHNPNYQPPTYDPERVKQELAAAGTPNGFKFGCAVLPSGARRQTMELMQAQMKPLGIDMEILPMESVDYVERLLRRNPPDIDAFFASGANRGDSPSVSGFEGWRKGSIPSFVDYPELIAVTDKVTATWDLEERKQLIWEAQDVFHTQLAIRPQILDALRPFAMRKEYTGETFFLSGTGRSGNDPDWRHMQLA